MTLVQEEADATGSPSAARRVRRFAGDAAGFPNPSIRFGLPSQPVDPTQALNLSAVISASRSSWPTVLLRRFFSWETKNV